MNKKIMERINKFFRILQISIIIILLIGTGTVNAQVKRKHKTVQHTIQKHKKIIRSKKTAPKKSPTKKTVTKNITVNKKPGVIQDTTTLPEDINGKNFTVTSSFTPTLRASSKINFSNSAALPAVEKIPLSYQIPAQNLTFTYRPAPLSPLAANIDTAIVWRNSDFVKLGYGNYSSPYLEGGFSFGDGTNSAVTLYAKHTQSKGNLPLQQFAKTDVDVSGTFAAGQNNQIDARVYFNNNIQYQYANLLPGVAYNKDSLRRRYNDFGIKVGLANKNTDDDELNYHPTVAADIFAGNRGEKETSFIIDAPFSKNLDESFKAKLGITADLTRYKTDTLSTVNNNLFYISPAIQYNISNFKLNIGVTPSIDNSDFHLLPDLSLEAKLKDERFIFQAGWKGYYNKNTYRSITAFNPWVIAPNDLYNTRANEVYGSFKGSAGDHFTYDAKLSYVKYTNALLYLNNDINSSEFDIIKDTMNDFKLHGEVGYNTNNFSLFAGITANSYSNIKNNDKAWGLPKMDITGSLRWNIIKNVLVKSDIDLMDGIYYKNITGETKQLKSSADWNAGAEWSIIKYVSLWAQVNNLLNNKYQRWNGYPVIGTQFLGGIIINFGQFEK
ncbi:MAG: hypothetical protein PW786_11605 [Arachidicoccus sp.]|nr:hypothetical protein [Arachidicoccus sp.]